MSDTVHIPDVPERAGGAAGAQVATATLQAARAHLAEMEQNYFSGKATLDQMREAYEAWTAADREASRRGRWW